MHVTMAFPLRWVCTAAMIALSQAATAQQAQEVSLTTSTGCRFFQQVSTRFSLRLLNASPDNRCGPDGLAEGPWVFALELVAPERVMMRFVVATHMAQGRNAGFEITLQADTLRAWRATTPRPSVAGMLGGAVSSMKPELLDSLMDKWAAASSEPTPPDSVAAIKRAALAWLKNPDAFSATYTGGPPTFHYGQAPPPPKAAETTVKHQALEGLMRDSSAVLALETGSLGLRDKRVGIVLSSRAVAEIERFQRERDALLAASSRLTGPAVAERRKFVDASDATVWLNKLLRAARFHAMDVQPMDDLSDLEAGRVDYAIVVHWRHSSRFDQLGKFDQFPPDSEVVGQQFAVLVLNRDLKLVRRSQDMSHWYSGSTIRPHLLGARGDHGYMTGLAMFFQTLWGKTTEDSGFYAYLLGTILK